MLLKLLKYEFKANYLKFAMMFSIYILLWLVFILFFRSNSELNEIFMTIGIITINVLTLITLFNRYNNNFYGNQGYLMFTLPVKGRSLLISKLISAITWIAIAATISAISFVVFNEIYSPKDIKYIFSIFNHNKQTSIIFAVNYIITSVKSLLGIYLAISVSKLIPWRKFGVVIGVVTYFATELISLIYFLVYKKGTSIFVDSNYIIQFSTPAFVLSFIIDAMALIGIFIVISYLLEKKINLK